MIRCEPALRWASLVAVLVAAAGCASPALVRPSVTVAPEASAVTAEAPPTTATAIEGLVAGPRALTDPTNDLVDEDGHKANRNPAVDLTRFEANADGTELNVTMTLDGDVPTKVSSTSQELNYIVEVEAAGAQPFDYWLLVTNLESGAWYAALTDWDGNSAEEDNQFPGTFIVAKNHVIISVPLAALGSPTRLTLMAVTQRADHASGKVVAEDQVPTGDQSIASKDWLTLTGR
jgi:hypothetical protein